MNVRIGASSVKITSKLTKRLVVDAKSVISILRFSYLADFNATNHKTDSV